MSDSETEKLDGLKSPWLVWAAGFVVAAVVLVGVWLVFTDPDQPDRPVDVANSVVDGEPAADQDGSDETVGEGDRVGVSSDECDVEESTDTELLVEAPEVEWEIVNTVALPLSDEHGPFVFTDTESQCYDRSPASALIASVHASKWIVSEDRRQAWLNLTAPGEGQGRVLRMMDEEEAAGEVNDPSAAPGSFCQMAGFSFIAFTPEQAIIDVVLRCPEGGLGSFISTMVWDEDRQTWLAVLQADATRSTTTKSVDSLDGFVPWGGI